MAPPPIHHVLGSSKYILPSSLSYLLLSHLLSAYTMCQCGIINMSKKIRKNHFDHVELTFWRGRQTLEKNKEIIFSVRKQSVLWRKIKQGGLGDIQV